MQLPPIPIIPTSSVYADYLNAARASLDALVRCTVALKDDEFRDAAQRILDGFDDDAIDAWFLINEANAPTAAAESYDPPISLERPCAAIFGSAS